MIGNEYGVTLLKRAEWEIDNAVEYITLTLMNKPAADRLHKKTLIAGNSLSSNPYRRPFVADEALAAKGLRLLPVNNYNLFYIVCEETKRVYIISFMYSGRNWTRLFNNTDFENIGEN
jgi:toxin ParE1/3/4